MPSTSIHPFSVTTSPGVSVVEGAGAYHSCLWAINWTSRQFIAGPHGGVTIQTHTYGQFGLPNSPSRAWFWTAGGSQSSKVVKIPTQTR